MNILYITHCDPRTTDFGSAQRSHLIWRSLQRLGTVYTVYNVGPIEPLSKDDSERIASWHLAPTFRPWLYLQVLFARWAAPASWPFRSKAFIRRQMPWKSIKFDAVVVRYLNSVAYSCAWQFGPVYVDIDDLPIESYDTVYAKQHGKLMARFWHGVVSRWQTAILRRCRGAWIANPLQIAHVTTCVSCLALPNLALPPKEGYCVNGKQTQQLMTIGLMSYAPNYLGVDWFVTTIWPQVREAFPDMTYVVAGKGCPEECKAKWSAVPGVRVMGFVDDLDALYETSLAVVTPILTGSGTCIKVMEAALHGRYVFATEFATRGYSCDKCDQLRIKVFEDYHGIVDTLEHIASNRDSCQLSIMSASEKINSFCRFSQVVAEGVAL